MKAALHSGAFELQIVDRPQPEIADEDHVLLRVGAVGICGSDKHDLETAPRVPQTPGHEFAGVVAALGTSPGPFRPGDRVLVRAQARCGRCPACCRRPRGECENPGVYGCRGQQHPPGAMAEYVLVRTENLTRLPDHVSFDHAAMADPLAVALHAIELGPPVAGQTCVVMGAGVIGLLLGQCLLQRGAGRVVMVDVLPSHLETARVLGLHECLLATSREHLVPRLMALESSLYYELAGGDSPTLDIAVQCIRPSGTILLISQRPKGVWLNYQSVMFKQLRLQGVAGLSDTNWDEAIRLIFNGAVALDPLITHRFPLAQVATALHTAVEGDSLKVIIHPNADLV